MSRTLLMATGMGTKGKVAGHVRDFLSWRSLCYYNTVRFEILYGSLSISQAIEELLHRLLRLRMKSVWRLTGIGDLVRELKFVLWRTETWSFVRTIGLAHCWACAIRISLGLHQISRNANAHTSRCCCCCCCCCC